MQLKIQLGDLEAVLHSVITGAPDFNWVNMHDELISLWQDAFNSTTAVIDSMYSEPASSHPVMENAMEFKTLTKDYERQLHQLQKDIRSQRYAPKKPTKGYYSKTLLARNKHYEAVGMRYDDTIGGLHQLARYMMQYASAFVKDMKKLREVWRDEDVIEKGRATHLDALEHIRDHIEDVCDYEQLQTKIA